MSTSVSQATVDRVYAIISTTLGIPVSDITLESVINDLSPDSIRLFELLLAFEQSYQIKTSYDDVIRLNTVGDIVTYIATHPLLQEK